MKQARIEDIYILESNFFMSSLQSTFGCSKKETKQVGVEEIIFNNPGWNLNWHRFSFSYPGEIQEDSYFYKI